MQDKSQNHDILGRASSESQTFASYPHVSGMRSHGVQTRQLLVASAVAAGFAHSQFCAAHLPNMYPLTRFFWVR